MIPLVLGTLLALAALAFVLQPLFFAAPAAPAAPEPAAQPGSSDREIAVAALREIEFDRATGKLADADYAELKRKYTARALEAQRREDRGVTVPDDEIEAAIRAARAGVCPDCGPRPEPDATFCSSCGRYLAERCAHCGAPATEPGSRFCTTCGSSLAA